MQIQSQATKDEASSSANQVVAGESESSAGRPQALDASVFQHVGGGRLGPVTCW